MSALLNLPVAVDPLAVSKIVKTPMTALCYREAQAWRMEEFARAACDMFARLLKRYCPNSASAVSTRASIGDCPNCDSIRFASVRCSTAGGRFFLAL
jgi:hypothetical protein